MGRQQPPTERAPAPRPAAPTRLRSGDLIEAGLLIVGFYVILLAALVAAIVFAVAMIQVADVIFVAVLVLPVSLLFVIWRARPRLNRFEAPGPLIGPERAPSLMELVNQTAGAVGVSAPNEVYLDNDPNAKATTRRSFLGRRRTVMVLGLPLLATLTRGETAAVLAHELGHLSAGDSRFSLFVGRFRRSMAEALDHQATRNASGKGLPEIQMTPPRAMCASATMANSAEHAPRRSDGQDNPRTNFSF